MFFPPVRHENVSRLGSVNLFCVCFFFSFLLSASINNSQQRGFSGLTDFLYGVQYEPARQRGRREERRV